jgi:hypothetical protein
VNHSAFNNPPSIELADQLIATLVKRFPKKWGAQIKRACEDSFAIFLEDCVSNTTYSIRSGRLLYLAVPKWAANSQHLTLDVEVIYQRARVSIPIPALVSSVPQPGDAAFIGPMAVGGEQ